MLPHNSADSAACRSILSHEYVTKGIGLALSRDRFVARTNDDCEGTL